MTHRLTHVVPVWAIVLAAPAAAQRAGTVEVGAFARYSNFDNSLGMDNTVGVGGRVGVYLRPSLALELDISRTSTDGPGGTTATYTPVRLRAVYNGTVGTRADALLGGGFVHNRYGDPYDLSDNGFSAILGVRYRLTDRLALRLGADADVMFHADSDSPFDFYHGNWGLHLGASVRLNAGGAP